MTKVPPSPILCHTTAWIERRTDWPPLQQLIDEGGIYEFCHGCNVQVALAPDSQKKMREGKGFPLCWECFGPEIVMTNEPFAMAVSEEGLERLRTHTMIPQKRLKVR